MINLLAINGAMGHGKDTVGSIIQYLSEYPYSLNKTDGKNRSYNSFMMDVGMGATPNWEIKKFAYKLKQIASILTGIPQEKFEDQEFKKSFLPNEWNYLHSHHIDMQEEEFTMTVREFLQRLATEGIRDNVHPNTFVNALFAGYTGYNEKYWKFGDGMGEMYHHAHCKSCKESFSGWKRQTRCAPCIEKEGTIYPKWIITDLRFPNEAQAVKDRGGIIIRVRRPENLKEFSSLNDEQMDYVSQRVITLKHPSETALDDWEFDWVIDNNGTIEELIEEVREMLRHFGIINGDS